MTPRLDAADMLWTLYQLGRTFERAQALVKKRMVDIRQGNLRHRRKPTKQLMEQRNQARDEIRAYIGGLTEDEQAAFTIALGDRGWAAKYNELINPANDPQVGEV